MKRWTNLSSHWHHDSMSEIFTWDFTADEKLRPGLITGWIGANNRNWQPGVRIQWYRCQGGREGGRDLVPIRVEVGKLTGMVSLKGNWIMCSKHAILTAWPQLCWLIRGSGFQEGSMNEMHEYILYIGGNFIRKEVHSIYVYTKYTRTVYGFEMKRRNQPIFWEENVAYKRADGEKNAILRNSRKRIKIIMYLEAANNFSTDHAERVYGLICL